MQAIKAIYDGGAFTPKQPIPIPGPSEVVMTFSEPIPAQQDNAPTRKIGVGFLKDKLPPVPDSFFDPLPEEELELWGL
jgi:hypothetical protein